MPLFNVFSSARSSATPPVPLLSITSGRPAGAGRPEAYGFFDSSLDLLTGLEVTEQDNDTMFQLWQLAQG